MRSSLGYALNPASVAIIGATDNRNKVGGRPIYYMKRFGYRGIIYPINPGRAQVQGVRCYPDLAALPEVPDLAVVAVSADRAMHAVRDCAERGVKVAVVMSSGFGETGKAGRKIERELVQNAARRGMRLIGPNAQGIANFSSGAVANFSTMFMEVAPEDGPIAIISQSGAASVMPYALLRERGLGVRYLMATGNDADVTVADLVDAVIEDPEIRLVLLYLESIKEAEALAAAAEKARARGVAIVAMKSGTSAKGISAASSHTGALATEDGVVSAFFRRHGIWRVRDVNEMVSAAPLYLSGRSPGQGRMLVMSHSGAVGVMCADTAERLGISVPDLSTETSRRLQEIVPSFGAIHNPVDLTAGLLSDGSMFGKALNVLLEDANVDVVHIGIPVAGEGYDVEGFAQSAAEISARAGKPVVISGPQTAVLKIFAGKGLPTYQNDTEALRSLKQYVDHRGLLSRRPAMQNAAPGVALDAGTAPLLSEADSLKLLAGAGISVVAHRVCNSLEEARRALKALGGRCVLKACSAEVPHKSEHGLVWLGINSDAEIEAAYEACVRRMGELGVRGSVVVARMESGRRELVIGARRDPTFGPVVLVGDGGKYIEALKDCELLAAPFAEDEVLQALKRLRIWPILTGVRGEPAVDLNAVCGAAVALGGLISALPQIESIDMNPVMVKEAGGGAIVLDALVTLATGSPGSNN
ncbi:MAG: acetate--CoA ligase family protein [Betaproteobacteria bacterium]|nr:acetate--CoA ligase family protein [Betaproteobacteria bacterium]